MIARAASFATDPDAVAAELYAALAGPDTLLVTVFASAEHDLTALAQALKQRFGTIPVIGCSSAAEITPDGYAHGTVSGFAFTAPQFAAVPVLVRDVSDISLMTGQEVVRGAVEALREQAPWVRSDQTFAFTLVDGLSGCEECLVGALSAATGPIPLFGGSAGDCLRFQHAYVLHDGQTYENAALFVLVATSLPFRVFKTDHFITAGEKLVVTAADPSSRTVLELNGEVAAEEYARIVGLDLTALSPRVFASHPVVVRAGGDYFIRSIQKMNPDHSLTFYCAIDRGIVLTVAHGADFVSNLSTLFDSLRAEIGPPAMILGFDCILRGLEMDHLGQRQTVGAMMAANNVIGFSTFGEQYQSMHVNQTLTGVAIGHPSSR